MLLSELAHEQSWINLVHYESSLATASGWRSAIHSSDFFLSANGSVDPLAELQATLVAFSEPPTSDPDLHAQCRFPARLLWLKKKLYEHPAFRADIKCPAYSEWTQSGSVSSLSVIYATGYLGNPASYYGHLLLKFNFRENQGKSNLMDVSVNYGAILDNKHDSKLSYLVKSVIGGYDGGFSHIRFYFHEHNYGEIELRDLWEYRLDLPQEAVNLMVAHAWEVLGKRYTYYFFRRNCAYRMAEILQVVDGLNIIPETPPWVIPQSLVQTLAHAQYRGKPLLAEVIYHPSRQSRFYEKYTSLSPNESSILKNLARNSYRFADAEFQGLPMSSKQAILDALLDYYQFADAPLDKAPVETRQAYATTLSTRYQLPPGVTPVNQMRPASPQGGHPPGWAQVGWWHNSITGNALSIRIRPAYYDVLDTDSSHVLNAVLGMFDTQINIRRGQAHLNRLDLLNVESVNPGLSGLPGDNGVAWKLRVGAEQLRLWCDNCLAARAQGDVGYGHQWLRGLFGAIYIGGALQDNLFDQGLGYAKASAALIIRPGDIFGMRLAYEQRFPIGSDLGSYGIMGAEARWALGLQSDLRISYEHDHARLLSMGLGVYW